MGPAVEGDGSGSDLEADIDDSDEGLVGEAIATGIFEQCRGSDPVVEIGASIEVEGEVTIEEDQGNISTAQDTGSASVNLKESSPSASILRVSKRSSSRKRIGS